MLKGKASAPQQDYPVPPAENHPGQLIGLIDLGSHWESFQNQAAKRIRKVFLVWEILADDDKHYIVGRDFNIAVRDDGSVSYGEKSNIRKLLSAWRGKDYAPGEEIDLDNFLGKDCLVNLSHGQSKTSGKTFASVEGASKMPRGMPAIEPDCPWVTYDADSDQEIPTQDWLPMVYGETVLAIVERCIEHGGSGIRTSAPAGANKAPTQPLRDHAAAKAAAPANDADAF